MKHLPNLEQLLKDLEKQSMQNIMHYSQFTNLKSKLLTLKSLKHGK